MKKIIMALTVILASTFMLSNVKASNARIAISTNKSTVVVGNTVTATFTVTSSDPLAAIYFTAQYDNDILSLISSNSSTGGAQNLDVIMNNSTYRKTYTYTFKAKRSGTSKIYVTNYEIKNSNNVTINPSISPASVKCMTQAEIEATYSKNNNLSGLSIDGYELSPAFNADTTEYTVTLKPETESIHINASKADSTATISGDGDVAVSDGTNTIKIDVTAQNGNTKTYTIVATVEELDPIELEVNDIKYTVVRSKKSLTFTNSLFTETTTQINGTDVPAFYNEITNTTLVGLKDSDGNIKYFIVTDDGYTEYKELTFGTLSLMIMDTNEIPYKYHEKEITINEVNYKAYVNDDNSRFSLIYGINLANGNKGFYSYDNYENTLARFDMDTLTAFKNSMKKREILIFILGLSSSLLLLGLIITMINKHKNTRNTKNKIDQIKDNIEDDFDITNKEEMATIDDKQDDNLVENIEEDNKDVIEDQVEKINSSEIKEEDVGKKTPDLIDEIDELETPSEDMPEIIKETKKHKKKKN